MGLGSRSSPPRRPRAAAADVDAVVAAAVSAPSGPTWCSTSTRLEHLRRGGRIGAAAALGRRRARRQAAAPRRRRAHRAAGEGAHASKALARLEDIAVTRAGDGPSTSRSTTWRRWTRRPRCSSRCARGSRRWCRRTSRRSVRSSAPTSDRPARGRGLAGGERAAAGGGRRRLPRRGAVARHPRRPARWVDLRGSARATRGASTSGARSGGGPVSSWRCSTCSRACCRPSGSGSWTTGRGCSPASPPCSGT
jgi:hypothetical protein